MAGESDDTGLAALQVRGRGNPELHDPRGDPGRALPHRHAACQLADARPQDPLAQHCPPLRDDGLRAGPPAR